MPNGLEWIRFVAALPRDYWYCCGVLFIKQDIPAERVVEIIKDHMVA